MTNTPKQNCPVDCQEPHGEILDLESGTVWQTYLPISKQAYNALDHQPELRGRHQHSARLSLDQSQKFARLPRGEAGEKVDRLG